MTAMILSLIHISFDDHGTNMYPERGMDRGEGTVLKNLRRVQYKIAARGWIMGSKIPVSYTHLDVYKRQR